MFGKKQPRRLHISGENSHYPTVPQGLGSISDCLVQQEIILKFLEFNRMATAELWNLSVCCTDNDSDYKSARFSDSWV